MLRRDMVYRSVLGPYFKRRGLGLVLEEIQRDRAGRVGAAAGQPQPDGQRAARGRGTDQQRAHPALMRATRATSFDGGIALHSLTP